MDLSDSGEDVTGVLDIGKRLRRFREENDITQEQLGVVLGVEKAAISKYENERLSISIESLKTISDHYNKPLNYFLQGLLEEKLKRIPILGVIRAGLPLMDDGNCIGEIEVPTALKADYALRVTGDSMNWAGISEGDLAIMRKIDSPSSGMVVAAGIEDAEWSATLKFYMEDNNRQVLRAANPEYEDTEITEQHRIIGNAVSIIKDPPSYYDYKRLLISKDIEDQDWQDAIEVCKKMGYSGETVKKIMEGIYLSTKKG